MSFIPPLFDQGLGQAKKGVDFSSRETYTLGTLGTESAIFNIPTIGASVPNTTVQAYFPLPGRIKISKLCVFCSAIESVAGTHSFNIVLGTTGAYTQGNIPGNDNSSVPPVSYNNLGQVAGPSAAGVAPTFAAGGGGFCTIRQRPGRPCSPPTCCSTSRTSRT